jgi:hypothetical protein
MSHAVIAPGDKLHLITRRLFEADMRRHFVGEVLAVEGPLCRLRGYTFVFTQGVNEFRRRPELRTRIFSVDREGYIINVVPREVDLDALDYRTVDKRLVITDGASFTLDINEFGDAR